MSAELPVPGAVVATLDPVAELLAGALPYHGHPIELPDAQPLPSCTLHRRVAQEGLAVAVTTRRGGEEVVTHHLDVPQLPLDPQRSRPRRRVHPAGTSVLTIVAAQQEPEDPAPGLEVHTTGGGDVTIHLPPTGPTPGELERIATLAREHRFVAVPGPLGIDPALAAALVLRISAAAIACAAAPEVAAGLTLLHPELRRSLEVAPELLHDDDLAVARAAADQRRAAWTHHDLRLAFAPDAAGQWRAVLDPPPRPEVAVLLATRRPGLLEAALTQLAGQRDVDVEVAVLLHGAGDRDAGQRVLDGVGLEGTVEVVDAGVPFGAVLNRGLLRTCAPLVTKWDDDDLYGPHHLLDLVLAQRHSRAALVGKAPEFVYLQASDTTVWRTPGRAEAPSVGLAGGTFLSPRDALVGVGGFPPVVRAVDHHLKTRFTATGQEVFRTHGFGFVLRRHGAGHTWEADDQRFLAQAVRTFEGLPSVLDLGDAARFAHLPGLEAGP